MTGKQKPYWHQSMFWSDLGPTVGYEAIGIVDSSLETVAVFAKSSDKDTPKAVVEETGEGLRSETEQVAKLEPEFTLPVTPQGNEEFGKGIIFYTKNEVIVGFVMWYLF
jgi:programmed cell death 8 (apoptosis-inducing factor)